MAEVAVLAQKGDADDLSAGQADRFKTVDLQDVLESDPLRHELERDVSVQITGRLGHNQASNSMPQPQKRFESEVVLMVVSNQGIIDLLGKVFKGESAESRID